MSVSLHKDPAIVLARHSRTREVFRASLTAIAPESAASVPAATPTCTWTFHVVTASPEALSRPYSERANAALQMSPKPAQDPAK